MSERGNHPNARMHEHDLPPHRHANHIAPLADLRVMQQINRLVSPHRAGAGGGVGGVGFGVHEQEDKALIVAPVHPNLDATGLALGPGDDRTARLDQDGQHRFPSGWVNNISRADNAQTLPDGGRIVFMIFDAGDHRGEARNDAGRHKSRDRRIQPA